MSSPSRRDFIFATLAPAIAGLQSPPGGNGARGAAVQANRQFLGTVPLGEVGGRAAPPFGRLLGAGLDARLFTDLSTLFNPQSAILNPQSAIVPTDRFFVRTAAPRALRGLNPEQWTIKLNGLVESPSDVAVRSLASETASGRFLLECSGNVDQSSYGLISTADWEGIPVAAVLARLRAASPRTRVLIEGLDDDASPGRTSIPGASWIFSRDDLDHALFATHMNGAALPPDHGAPLRLVVPGWYGCACIKWVTRVALVADDAAPTSQMREFAARTHQPSQESDGPRLAREFIPAAIDTAAMPVRVEKWIENGKIVYRIVGILWGGTKPTNALSIRFKSGQPWVRVDDCPLPASTRTWTMWTHAWRPDAPGRYQIVLRVDDPSIRTRRLDVFFYVRQIDIDEV